MPRTINRAKKRALKTEKPLRAILRARKRERKATEPVKFIIRPKHPSIDIPAGSFISFGRHLTDGIVVKR